MANINKNIIMQAGAAVANAANKAAGLPAATPEPGSIISVIQLVNGGRTIGPDALAHFTESVRNKLLSLLVTLEPIQDFNGFDHPWPAGGGVNKFDADESFGDNGFVLQPDGSWYLENLERITLNTVMWECPSSYTGQVTLQYYYKNVNSSGSAGGRFKWKYTDGTTEPIYTNNSTSFIVKTNTSTSGKRVKSLLWDFGTATNSTWFKDCEVVLDSTAPAFYSPYSNICPISGRTGLHVYAGPTSAIGDATTYSMNWTSPAGTVYAGSADIVSGDIKAAPYYASYNGETLVGPWVSSMDVYDPEGTPTTGAQVVDLGGTMTEYHITGQDIITLVGDNYIWSDSGDVTIKE